MIYKRETVKLLSLLLILSFAFCGCSRINEIRSSSTSTTGASSLYVFTHETTSETETTPEEEPTETTLSHDDFLAQLQNRKERVLAKKDYYDSLNNIAETPWCFIRQSDHTQSGTYEYFKIQDYSGYYLNTNVTDEDKVIYLTFDCGYPTNRTQPILDTLAAHDVKANFFVTGMYIAGCPEFCKRMKEEGHMVCNHTVNHEDLTLLSVEQIVDEIFDVAEAFYETTGYPIDPYFRPPTGTYTQRMMSIIRDSGYQTMFWSLAYDDYDQNNQPAPGFVIDHFQKFHHNGAIVLMHNDSQSNVDELDAVLTYLEGEGYRFGLLDEIAPEDIPPMPDPTPTPAPTPSPTPTPDPTPMPTPVPTETPTPTPAPTATPTPTNAPTNTPGATPTDRPTPTPKPSSTPKPTTKPTPTPKPTQEVTPTQTPTPEPSATPNETKNT